jgi:hypothetical protein
MKKRFKIGDVIKKNNKLYQCVAIDKDVLAVFAKRHNGEVFYKAMFAVANNYQIDDCFKYELIIN